MNRFLAFWYLGIKSRTVKMGESCGTSNQFSEFSMFKSQQKRHMHSLNTPKLAADPGWAGPCHQGGSSGCALPAIPGAGVVGLQP